MLIIRVAILVSLHRTHGIASHYAALDAAGYFCNNSVAARTTHNTCRSCMQR